jgi:ketosteroid isomerase-like protein
MAISFIESSEEIRQAFRESFARLNKGDLAGYLELWAEDSVLIIPESAPGGGIYRGKSEIKQYLELTYKQQIKDFQLTVKHVVSRGQVVSVEWFYQGRAWGDQTFENQTVSVFRLNSQGLIREAREYTDTQRLREALMGETNA